MRPYIGRHLLGIGAAAVAVVVALCVGWPFHAGVAQVDDAADDAILTVGGCVEVDASGSPLEEALVEEGVIEDDLLRTRVTDGMCEEMHRRITGRSPARRLLTAQDYMQEVELVEGAMREAAGQAAAKGSDWYASSDKSTIQFRAVAQASEQAAAQTQYKEPGDDGEPGGDGTKGDGTGGVGAGTRQAAAVASVGEGGDASIAERLRRKEAAARGAGASVPEARAGARCSTEVEVSDDELKKGRGLYEVKPLMPEEMRLGESEQAGLLVSPVSRDRFEQIRQKHRSIENASASGIGCVELVDRMKAQLVPLEEGLGYRRHHPDDIRELSSARNTRWGWDIIARRQGNLGLLLDLRYAISRESQEFRRIPGPPVFEGDIRVTAPQEDSDGEAAQRPWWRRIGSIFEGIIERIFGT